jgi:hypothetical protein
MLKAGEARSLLKQLRSVAYNTTPCKAGMQKQALIGDNIGGWVGNHFGQNMAPGWRTALGAAAGTAADTFIPGAMAIDSFQGAGHNVADATRDFASGSWGHGLLNVGKGLGNAGLGALSLVPGVGGIGAKGLGWGARMGANALQRFGKAAPTMMNLGKNVPNAFATAGKFMGSAVPKGMGMATGATKIMPGTTKLFEGMSNVTGGLGKNIGKGVGNVAQWAGGKAIGGATQTASTISRRAEQFGNSNFGKALNKPWAQAANGGLQFMGSGMGSLLNRRAWGFGGGNEMPNNWNFHPEDLVDRMNPSMQLPYGGY